MPTVFLTTLHHGAATGPTVCYYMWLGHIILNILIVFLFFLLVAVVRSHGAVQYVAHISWVDVQSPNMFTNMWLRFGFFYWGFPQKVTPKFLVCSPDVLLMWACPWPWLSLYRGGMFTAQMYGILWCNEHSFGRVLNVYSDNVLALADTAKTTCLNY